jgi:hypothetical protein
MLKQFTLVFDAVGRSVAEPPPKLLGVLANKARHNQENETSCNQTPEDHASCNRVIAETLAIEPRITGWVVNASEKERGYRVAEKKHSDS